VKKIPRLSATIEGFGHKYLGFVFSTIFLSGPPLNRGRGLLQGLKLKFACR
jgi:hypothetical protein